MTEQEIIQNAPEDAVGINRHGNYIYHAKGVRALEDIKRIVALEKTIENHALATHKLIEDGYTQALLSVGCLDLDNHINKIKADAIREAVDNLTFDGLGTIKKLLDYADKLEQSE